MKASAIEAIATNTEGSEENRRVRKRRRIDSGSGENQPQSAKRSSTRKKNLSSNLSSTTCDLPAHDEYQAQPGLPGGTSVDSHPAPSVGVDGKSTERNLERPRAASGGAHSLSKEDSEPHNRGAEIEDVIDGNGSS